MNLFYATPSEAEWLAQCDSHVSPQWIERCINQHEIVIAQTENKPVGFLRFSYFWGKIPYMDMVWIETESRNKGIGTTLYRFWESEMRQQGHALLMTSAVQDELDPQAWHLRNGFTPSGHLTFGHLQATPEVFFIKEF